MPYSIDTKRLTLLAARMLAAAALLGGVLAGCGGSSNGPASGASTSASAASEVQSGVAFSRCIRSHGVPNAPDPQVSGQAVRMSPRLAQSPAFQSAMRSCQSLLPKGAPSSELPSPQAQAQLLGVSSCMRRHGFGDFPDPTTSPPNRADLSGIVGKGGYYLAIPKSIDTNSPAFERAAATCNLR